MTTETYTLRCFLRFELKSLLWQRWDFNSIISTPWTLFLVNTDSKSEPGLREKIMFHRSVPLLTWTQVCGTVCDEPPKWFKYRNVSFISWWKDITSIAAFTHILLAVLYQISSAQPCSSQQSNLSFPLKSGGSQISAHSSSHFWHRVAALQKDSAFIFIPSHAFSLLQRASPTSNRGRHSCLQSTSPPTVVSNFEYSEI